MAYVVLALLVIAVLGLSWLSARTGQRPQGCCAPADPHDDLRMRAALCGDHVEQDER